MNWRQDMHDYAHEFNQLGEKFYQQGDYDSARKQFENALNIDSENYHSLNNIGVVCAKLGDYTKAEEHFRKAISVSPTYAEGYNNLGNVLRLAGYQKTAERYLDIALNLNPVYEGALLNLGLVTEDIGNLKKSLKCNEKAYELTRNPEYLSHLYYLKRRMCDWNGLAEISKKLDKNISTRGETPFINIFRSDNEKKNYKVAKVWTGNYKAKKTTRNITQNTKIRVGYISETFRDHPVGNCVYEILKYHNKKKFETFVYSYGVDDGSSIRKFTKKYTGHFFNIRRFDIKRAIHLIKSHNIDILIDLQGHTKDNRIEILAGRPAPIQISYLGFPGTSGTKFIDYLISDKIAAPKSSQRFYSEKIVYLPRCYQVNSALPVSKKKVTRADFNLPDDKVVFCSFNRSLKIEKQVFGLWLKILKAVPDSVLWLYLDNAYIQGNLLSYALQKGASPERFIFSDRMTIDKHLARLKLADVALDTFIYSGGATTANALRVNVPVVTLRGRHFLSRMSESILTAVRLNQLVAKNKSDYIKIAVKLASDKAYYKKTVEIIKKNKKNIFDTKAFTRDWENALANICKKHKK